MTQQPSNDISTNDSPDVQTDLSFWTTVLSVIQASFGVQSQKNKERDFQYGKLLPFIVAGLGFTVVFVLTLYLIVQWVLSAA